MNLLSYEDWFDYENGWIGATHLGTKHTSSIAEFGYSDLNLARAKLAAQAPAMARLLVELQWSGCNTEDGSLGVCPSCLGTPEPNPEGFITSGVHAPDCKLINILKAAGVVE